MRDILSGSIIVRALNRAAQWIDGQWNKSPAAQAFLKKSRNEKASESSVFTKIFDGFHRILNKIFKSLKLDRLLEGSVFGRLVFWCCLAVAAAPILPTMAVLALVLMAFVSWFIRLGCDGELKSVYSPANLFIWLFAFVYLASSFASVTTGASIQVGLLSLVFILFAIVLINAVRTDRDENILVYVVVAAGAAVALYGIYQSVSGMVSNEAWVDENKFDSISLRVYSTLENPNVLAEYLLLVIPLAVSLVFTEKNPWCRAFGLCASGALVVCMLMTYSRAGWLGLIASAALFLVIIDRRFIVVGIVGAAALLFVLPESILARLTSVTDLSDSSTTYRISIWLATIAMLKDYWFCGVGTGVAAYSSVYPLYSFNAVVTPHAHNLYLQIMCECGIAGIVVFIGVLFTFFRACARGLASKPGKTVKLRLTALMSGMFGFLVQGLADHSFYNYRVMLMFWVTVALGMIISRDRSEREV